jgi:TRAP-type C4-dicarboxylate transport system substrate-binding protein
MWSCLFLVGVVCAAPGAARAGGVTIKLGTMAPDGSTWHQLLKEMAADWSKASDGLVTVKIYPSGVAGNETDMLRKMRIGQLQAAAMSVVGLAGIDRAPQAIACPGLIADDAEWNHVFERATAVWQKRFAEKGFVVLMWGDTGWVHMFTKKAVRVPADLAGMKVFAWSGDSAATRAFQLAGFQPVALSATDILPSLSTGMIDGFAMTPIMALTARWYEQTPYMTRAAWGHLPGGTIVTRAAWEKIPEPIRGRLLEIAQVYGKRVNAEVARLQADSIVAMQKNGLTVVEFDDAGRAQWQQLAERTWPAVRGGMVKAEDFDAVKQIRDDYRASKAR